MSKKGNYIVINGIRYDVVEDHAFNTCTDCDLFDICICSVGIGFCNELFSKDVHFEKHK